jgi:hypothetical protein
MASSEYRFDAPATASRLNAAWLKITGKNKWNPSKARIFSSEWLDLPNQVNSEVGHHLVTYSYWVDGAIYDGKFADYGRQDEGYLKRDDEIEIRYNPRRPSQSYYPELRTRTNFVLISIAIGGVLGLIVLLFSFFR